MKRFSVRRTPYETYLIWDGEHERVCDGYYAVRQMAIAACRSVNAAVARGIDPWGPEVIYCHNDLHHEALAALAEVNNDLLPG
jgi:hypothetical protein